MLLKLISEVFSISKKVIAGTTVRESFCKILWATYEFLKNYSWNLKVGLLVQNVGKQLNIYFFQSDPYFLKYFVLKLEYRTKVYMPCAKFIIKLSNMLIVLIVH